MTFRSLSLPRSASMLRSILITAALFAGSTVTAALPSSASSASIRTLVGAWRVVAVQVEPSSVQALVTNDPSLMGAILDITPERLSWRRPHKTSSLSLRCVQPRMADGGITCRDGDFGPPDSRVTRAGKRLMIEWFDGGTLVMIRVR